MMETRNLVGMILAVTVGTLCIGMVLMPIISEATATQKTFTNDGVFYYGVFTPEDTYTLEYDLTDGTIIVNGTTVTPIDGISTTEYADYSLVSSDNLLFRFGSTSSGYFDHIIGQASNGNNIRYGGVSGSVSIEDGYISVVAVDSSDNSVTYTFSFTEMYAITPSVDEAVLKVSSDHVYIKGDSYLYASGLTTVNNWSNMFHFEGTYDDGITITSPNTAATFDNIVWNIESVSGYEDLYLLDSIEFDITSGDTTVHATYSYFAVPSDVTADKSAPFSSTEILIISMIPVLVILAVFMVAVRGITRND